MTLPAILLVCGVLLLFGAIEDQSVPSIIASIMRGEAPPKKGEKVPEAATTAGGSGASGLPSAAGPGSGEVSGGAAGGGGGSW